MIEGREHEGGGNIRREGRHGLLLSGQRDGKVYSWAYAGAGGGTDRQLGEQGVCCVCVACCVGSIKDFSAVDAALVNQHEMLVPLSRWRGKEYDREMYVIVYQHFSFPSTPHS